MTKADRVDERRLQEVRGQIAALLAATRTTRRTRLRAQCHTRQSDLGTAGLRRYLLDTARTAAARRDQRLFRLAVDRVFTLAGHGTVATGTVFSGAGPEGRYRLGDAGGTSARVRSIHAQKRPSNPGGRASAARSIWPASTRARSARGDWLAEPRVLEPTMRIDVRLRLLAGSGLVPWVLVAAARALGHAHRVAHVVLLEAAQLSAGESARIQLVFAAPVCAMPGDRFIVRDAQAAHTVGGGVRSTLRRPRASDARPDACAIWPRSSA